MLSKVLTFCFVVLLIQALCALADAVPVTPTRVTTEVEGWRTVFRRNLNEMLEARQTGGSKKTGNSGGSGSTTLDISSWRMNATQACADQLRNTKVSNAAGLAACYNIATFSKDKWTFLADLRLFKLSTPSKEWQEVGTDVKVSIGYKTCGVVETKLGNSSKVVVSDGPQLVKEYYFAGEVYENYRKSNATAAQMRQILTPTISVVGKKSDGTQIGASLSDSDELFIIGQFAQISDPDPPPTGSKQFVLPGTRIEIMPIGLIIYSVYMFIGVSIVMYGTLQRQRFREEYRRLTGRQ